MMGSGVRVAGSTSMLAIRLTKILEGLNEAFFSLEAWVRHELGVDKGLTCLNTEGINRILECT